MEMHTRENARAFMAFYGRLMDQISSAIWLKVGQ